MLLPIQLTKDKILLDGSQYSMFSSGTNAFASWLAGRSTAPDFQLTKRAIQPGAVRAVCLLASCVVACAFLVQLVPLPHLLLHINAPITLLMSVSMPSIASAPR